MSSGCLEAAKGLGKVTSEAREIITIIIIIIITSDMRDKRVIIIMIMLRTRWLDMEIWKVECMLEIKVENKAWAFA